MSPLKIGRLPRPLMATAAVILGVSLIGITTVVLARVIKTDKKLP
jgi:hypothetical protein